MVIIFIIREVAPHFQKSVSLLINFRPVLLVSAEWLKHDTDAHKRLRYLIGPSVRIMPCAWNSCRATSVLT
jgi:hypothetical protein